MSTVEDDEPLDPKVEAIRRKMVRLLMVSGGIMMIGLMTVLIAIVYKLNSSGDAPSNGAAQMLTVPKGAQVISSTASADTIALTIKRPDGGTDIMIYSLTGTLLQKYSVREE